MFKNNQNIRNKYLLLKAKTIFVSKFAVLWILPPPPVSYFSNIKLIYVYNVIAFLIWNLVKQLNYAF